MSGLIHRFPIGFHWGAAASAHRHIGMTPAARWKASSRSIGGIEAAIGA